MNDNEFHSHDCIQVSRAISKSLIHMANKEVVLEVGKVIIIAHKVKHRIEKNQWTNILIDNECVVGEELGQLLAGKEYCIVEEHEIIKKLFGDPKSILSQINENVREEVKKAILLIATHDHNCDLLEIAKEVALSPDRFRKIFKEEIGITFKNFLRWQKIKRAFTLLSKDPHTKLVDLAHASGFADQAHMTKIIKETFGYNPKNIKNNL
ncbi:hypothetical protein A9Q84_14925 [Halobacteriovorax marinus]|uniref:HTH araC/xylS-type domain-containing protein n=1 Tax=Halobacteriovorax marinus TaxID=97084 RepID=A0A1Y5F559_9BACT|nr:hypothetical protein A9Q84_14925 [Halobacteriovorax marinus]